MRPPEASRESPAVPPPPPLASTAPEPTRDPRVAILLAAAAIVGGVLGGLAAYRSDSAQDDWHRAEIEQVKHGAAIAEGVSYVYQTIAPDGFGAAEARIRADALRHAEGEAKGVVKAELEDEAKSQDVVALQYQASDIVADPRYRLGGGFDLVQRLADERAGWAEVTRTEPRELVRSGDKKQDAAQGDMRAASFAALAFLFGAMAQGYGARRRAIVLVGALVLAVAIFLGAMAEVTA
jgi:hypothetical protein